MLVKMLKFEVVAQCSSIIFTEYQQDQKLSEPSCSWVREYAIIRHGTGSTVNGDGGSD